MKLKAASLYLGLCLAILAVAASPAYARSTTAFNSFRVRLPIDATQNPYNCLTESEGALINNCTYLVRVAFDLSIEHSPATLVHTVKVQNFVNGTGSVGATCNVWSYDGNGGGMVGTSLTFNPNGIQTLTFRTVLFGDNITLLCDLPVGEGVSAISWNP